MKNILNPRNPRFWLFAPFIGLGLLAVIYLFIWQVLADGINEAMLDNGVSWQSNEVSGFPARLTFDIEQPAWQGDGMSWRNPAMQMTLMPFNDQHAIVDFKGAHQIGYSGHPLTLDHEEHMVSVVADLEGLARLSMDVTKPNLQTTLDGRKLEIYAAHLDAQMRRQPENAARYDLAVESEKLFINRGKEIGRLTGLFDYDLNLLTETDIDALAGEKITVQKLNLTRGELTLAARGTLVLGKSGHLRGKLDLNFVNLRALLDALEEFGLSKRRDRNRLLLLGGLATAFGGSTQDRINLTLHFRDKSTYLDKIKLGPAPRWRP